MSKPLLLVGEGDSAYIATVIRLHSRNQLPGEFRIVITKAAHDGDSRGSQIEIPAVPLPTGTILEPESPENRPSQEAQLSVRGGRILPNGSVFLVGTAIGITFNPLHVESNFRGEDPGQNRFFSAIVETNGSGSYRILTGQLPTMLEITAVTASPDSGGLLVAGTLQVQNKFHSPDSPIDKPGNLQNCLAEISDLGKVTRLVRFPPIGQKTSAEKIIALAARNDLVFGLLLPEIGSNAHLAVFHRPRFHSTFKKVQNLMPSKAGVGSDFRPHSGSLALSGDRLAAEIEFVHPQSQGISFPFMALFDVRPAGVLQAVTKSVLYESLPTIPGTTKICFSSEGHIILGRSQAVIGTSSEASRVFVDLLAAKDLQVIRQTFFATSEDGLAEDLDVTEPPASDSLVAVETRKFASGASNTILLSQLHWASTENSDRSEDAVAITVIELPGTPTSVNH
jgi:hypothetical protein